MLITAISQIRRFLPVPAINSLPYSNNDLQISPNPSTGLFIIKLPELAGALINGSGEYTLTIYNVLGEKISQLVSSAAENTVSLKHQPAGIYFIEARQGENVWLLK